MGDIVFGSYWLGVSYFKGSGVDKNLDKAIEYLTLASKAGNCHADEDLFLLYSTEPEKKDIVKAYTHLVDGLENGVTKYAQC